MSQAEWEEIYRDAWSLYYTPEHMKTILRRAAATRIKTFSIVKLLLWFSASPSVERVHPLQGGVVRLKTRLDRRPELPIEPVWSFYPKFVWETVAKNVKLITIGLRLQFVRRRIDADPAKLRYTDQALTAVKGDDTDTLEIFNHSDAAKGAVKHAHRIAELTHDVG